ncbi:8-oxoguanine DNA glycosylase [Pseudomonas aeruginosa]|uniref:8-oxoguanine DNA glycosylase n=1 Tax=Pseudomonas aeruginosa TaxID=287 RepID=UPI002B279F58|nr:8-oxoguanine DNA glycosylase [Pseudomonas aeruginosa]MEA8593057.1 8-oxoguanine DNA glycosylase [Pseudomonas aeruginosa]
MSKSNNVIEHGSIRSPARQSAAVLLDQATISIELPGPTEEVVPGVLWGPVEGFPSPAYWAYQVLCRRILGITVNYKLGNTLREEIGACLLGGHGIPARIGVAAFQHVRQKGAFLGIPPDEQTLLKWLKEPLLVDGRQVHYRFAAQKAKYLSAALAAVAAEEPPSSSGKELRTWLLQLPGIGYKTGSWIARNWLDADDVAILDIHVLRAGKLGRFFTPELTVERHYLALEEQFIQFSFGLGVRPSELDALIWLEMSSANAIVHTLLSGQEATTR